MSTGPHNMAKNDIESDIEIGAVEIKDHTDDRRESVALDGAVYPNALNGSSLFAIDPATGILRALSHTLSGIQRLLDVNVVSIAAIANRSSFTARRVTIVTAGTPVQLPSVVIPDGFDLVVKNNVSNAANREIYVADSAANAVVAGTRFTLANGDSINLKLDNADRVFVDSNFNGTFVDLAVET